MGEVVGSQRARRASATMVIVIDRHFPDGVGVLHARQPRRVDLQDFYEG
jgi:hypothetical protein